MKISTRGRYGIRFLIDIAEQGPGKQASLSEISERQQISPTYLGQIAIVLKRARFIRSIKGSSGGFVLAKPPADIPLDSVLEALEGDLKIVERPLPTVEETPFRKALRIGLYDKLDEALSAVLKSITLDKLVSKKSSGYMYYI